MKYMLDTNAFDCLAERWEEVSSVIKNCSEELYVTPVQIEELEKIPEDNHKKIKIRELLASIKINNIPTPAIAGASVVGQCVATGQGDIYSDLLLSTLGNAYDAMIGSVGTRERCVVVTNDKRFIKKLESENVEHLSVDDFVKILKAKL